VSLQKFSSAAPPPPSLVEGLASGPAFAGLAFPFAPWDADLHRKYFLAQVEACLQGGGWLYCDDAAEGRPNCLALYRPSPWDTKHFAVNAGFLDCLYCRRPEDYGRFARRVTADLRAGGQVFIARKTPGSPRGEIKALEGAGFACVDCELTLLYAGDGPARAPTPEGIEIRRQDQGPPAGLENLAIPFLNNRFVFDDRIAPAKARELWEQAVHNSFRGLADLAVVALEGGAPIGLVTLQDVRLPGEDTPTGNLFLVGVDQAHAGRGVTARLMDEVIDIARDRCQRVLVETSASNHRALNFYIKHGFNQAIYSKFAMHAWLD
jgi:ribosomal protein S18 acetylase RimI-like enzyme